MDLSTIVIEPDEAKARLAEYEAAFKRDRLIEDAAMAQGYRAAARGLPIIQLSQVINSGGCFPNGLPRLAVARADATSCTVHCGHQFSAAPGIVFYSDLTTRWPRSGAALVGKNHVTVRATPEGLDKHKQGETMVPSVPPRFRPKRSRLRNFHVLWEVEKWERVAPVDPALIRHIRGDLWSVLAVWDLTELERAVLAQRA